MNIYENGEYIEKNRNWHEEDSDYKASLIIQQIYKNNLKPLKIADVGCGAGLVTEILAKQFESSEVTGFDLSSDVRQFWEKRTKFKNLKFDHSDFIKQNTHTFDLIVCMDVMEHVEDYFGFLRSLNSMGEHFIFNIPLDMNIIKLITPGIKLAREKVGHLHYFNEYTALQTLNDCNFELISKKLQPSYFNLPPRNFSQFILLPFRVIFSIFGIKFVSILFGGVSLTALVKRKSHCPDGITE